MPVKKIIAYYTEFAPESENSQSIDLTIESVDPVVREMIRTYIAEKNAKHLIDGPYGKYQAKSFELVDEFVERVDRKKRKFSALEQALQTCKQEAAFLIITDLQELVRNDAFTGMLLRSQIDFCCLDQPSINKVTLPTLVETFGRMRMRHSERIRNALKQTAAKLGNPNALKEITKVNKPKRENAVMFALMLAPIIDMYRKQGYSQRKMVDALNNEGYLAPEGGQWVLSQLQKVLERIEMNNAALALSETLQEFATKSYTMEQQVKALNAMGAKAPGRAPWDARLVGKLNERVAMIKDIMIFNQFVIQVFPKLLDYQESGLSDNEIAERLNEIGADVPGRVAWEIQHQSEQEIDFSDTIQSLEWGTEEIELARQLAVRRQQDIGKLVNKSTMSKAINLLDEVIETQ